MSISPLSSLTRLQRLQQQPDLISNQGKQTSPNVQQKLLQKYLPQSYQLFRCLPAKFSHQPIYGELTINCLSIIFDSTSFSKSKHVIYRCRMLGYSSDQCPYFDSSIGYTIHTNCKMLKYYLKDMKLSLVEVLDKRNYEPIAHFYINWLTHIRSLEDNQSYRETDDNDSFRIKSKQYFLPFIDEQCTMTLPLYDYRNPKTTQLQPTHKNQLNQKPISMKVGSRQKIVGQVKIKFLSKVYQNPISTGYLPQSSKNIHNQSSPQDQEITTQKDHQNQNRIRNPNYLEIPHINQLPSRDNVISSGAHLPQGRQSEDPMQMDSYRLNNNTQQNQRQSINQSIVNEKSQYYRHSQKVAYESIYQDGPDEDGRVKRVNSVNENKQKFQFEKLDGKSKNVVKNQLQLLQLKLDVQDFFKLSGEQNHDKKEDKTVIQIVKLKSKLQNINQLDIFLKENQDQSSGDGKANNNKPQFKIYRISNDKIKNEDFFKSKIIIQRSSQRLIEVDLPNNLGKCVFRCKDLTATHNDIFLYNKGSIVGTLTVKKQTPPKVIYTPINPTQQISSSKDAPKSIENNKDKICIVVVDNFNQNFNKRSEIPEISHLDNYRISIKGVEFFHQTLNNSKSTGEYSIINSQNIPKLFAVEVINSSNEFVGMSQNIQFQGNQIPIIEQNIMPTLILEKNISLNLKQMPAFKKLPNSINFRLSIYISNTNQLNHFINKWKQNLNKNKLLQAKRQKSYSNVKPINLRQHQKLKERQYTISDEVMTQTKNNDKRMRTESQNKNSISVNDHQVQSKTSKIRESDRQRFKTFRNYTEDVNDRAVQGNRRTDTKQNQDQYSQKQGNEQEDEEGEIYLVEFFCKSLHYVLSKLGSKKVIEQKLTELSSYKYSKRESQPSQQSVSQQNSFAQDNKGFVSKEQFERILSIFIGTNNQIHLQILGFDLIEILQALFISEDGLMINLHQFTLCLMAYYNFLLLLANEKLTSLKQVLSCDPEAEEKLKRIQDSMTNISSQFLWDDVLPNVIERTRKTIDKRYRIYANTPFSVSFLLKDLGMARKNMENSQNETLFMSLLHAFSVEEEKKYEQFVRTTADLGNLVRQTVQEIIFKQCLINNSSVIFQSNWLQNIESKINEFVQKQNFQSIQSAQRNQFCLNLTQFQEFFSLIGIQTSIWQSLMLIEEIKVWHQTDEQKDKGLVQTGQGVITVELLKAWFSTLNVKMEMKKRQFLIGQKIKTKSSRLNSVKSIDSDQENIIEQINKKPTTNKITNQNKPQNLSNVNQNAKSSIHRVQIEQNPSAFNEKKYNNVEYRYTQRNSLKQSRQMNNESDIANIANLLRENQNNLYFMPSIADPDLTNRMIERRNISESDILRGLQQNTLRNVVVQQSPAKKTQVAQKKRREERIESQSSEGQQVEERQIQKKKIKLDPIDCFISITVKEIKVKRKQVVLKKQGLKKLVLSLKKNLTLNQEQQTSNQQQGKQYFFLTEETMHMILDSDKLSERLQSYSLSNFKVDINDLYDFESLFSQGFSLELFNLTASTQQSKQKRIPSGDKVKISSGDKVEELLLAGVLPIEDVLKVIEEYKSRLQYQAQKIAQNSGIFKKKTMVLYSGREISGKAVIEISVLDKRIQKLEQTVPEIYGNLTTIQFSFVTKELFAKNKKQNKNQSYNKINNRKQNLMSLSYVSIRDQQKPIELISEVEQNSIYEINLPEPIIQYQLLLRTLQEDSRNQQMEVGYQSAMSISRFTQFRHNNNMTEKNSQGQAQCVIPLQTLYFKKKVHEEYPLIDQTTGRFISSIQVQLQTVDTTQDDLSHKVKTEEVDEDS